MADNPNDPMLKSGPARQQELFKHFCQLANGFSSEEVLGAAANLFVNALRQTYPTRDGAMGSCDAIVAKTKELLASHYDQMGRRRNVFPFHQIVEMPHFTDRDFKNGR